MILSEIQKQLKAPKGQFNSFGKYHYRSCEDILEAVKPLLGESVLTITDEIVLVGDRYYIKATARLIGETAIEVSAYAREQAERKGMDESQVTGSASSYARKYALNGLFLIDDTKDADHGEPEKKEPKAVKREPAAPPTETKIAPPGVINDAQRIRFRAIATDAKYTNDAVKKILTACGYSSSKDILDKHYQVITEFIEGTPIEQVDATLQTLVKFVQEN
jgi:hypothetical protein